MYLLLHRTTFVYEVYIKLDIGRENAELSSCLHKRDLSQESVFSLMHLFPMESEQQHDDEDFGV